MKERRADWNCSPTCWTRSSPISRNCVNTRARSPWSSNSVTSSSNRVNLPERPASRDPSLRACAGWLQICLRRIRAASTSPRRRMPLAFSASASSWSTTCWYIAACSRVSLAYAICSILSGRSGSRRRSALVRRRMNGCVSRRSARCGIGVAVAFDRRAEFSRNLVSPPSRPGLTASRIDQSSLEPVLDRRAGEGDLLAGAQLADRPSCLRVRVLDHLCLVEHHRRPFDRAEVFEVAGQQPVRGDDDLAFWIAAEQRVVARSAEPVGAAARCRGGPARRASA